MAIQIGISSRQGVIHTRKNKQELLSGYILEWSTSRWLTEILEKPEIVWKEIIKRVEGFGFIVRDAKI